MFMANFKKGLGISLIFAIVLLSGCRVNSGTSQNEGSVVSSAQPAEITDEISEISQVPFAFPADRVYGDDRLVPDQWIPVDSWMEGWDKVNEILSSDTSGDPESAIPALMDKNRLVFLLIYVHGNSDYIYKCDWDSPYESPNFEKPIYPLTFTSEYFTDLQDIYKLVYDT